MEGACRAEGSKEGKMGNCNSIINKIYLKKTKPQKIKAKKLR